MKQIELTRSTGSIGDYIAEAREGPVLLTRKGKAAGALLAVDDAELERAKPGDDPWFLAIIERTRTQIREGQTLTTEEVRRHLGIPPKRAAREKRAVAASR